MRTEKDYEEAEELIREIGIAIEDFRERYPEIAFFEKELAQIMHFLSRHNVDAIFDQYSAAP